jgi:hypothetical protein
MPSTVAVAVDPSFWRYARKFLYALAAAVVGASVAILAAVDDDHVTTKEAVGITLEVLALIVGPAAVYQARNATRARDIAAAVPPERFAKPTVRKHVDGTVDLVWPEGGSPDPKDIVIVSRALIEGIVQQHNRLTLAQGTTTAPPKMPPQQWTGPA